MKPWIALAGLAVPLLAPRADEAPKPPPPAVTTAHVEVAFKGTICRNGTDFKGGFTLDVTAPWVEGKGWTQGEGLVRIRKIDDGYAEMDSTDAKTVETQKQGLKEALKASIPILLGTDGRVTMDLTQVLAPPESKKPGRNGGLGGTGNIASDEGLHEVAKRHFASDLPGCLSLLFALRNDALEGSGDIIVSGERFREAVVLDPVRQKEKTSGCDTEKGKARIKTLEHQGPYIGEPPLKLGQALPPDVMKQMSPSGKGEIKGLSSSGTYWTRLPEGILWKYEDKTEWALQVAATKTDKGYSVQIKRTRKLACSNLKVDPPKPVP